MFLARNKHDKTSPVVLLLFSSNKMMLATRSYTTMAAAAILLLFSDSVVTQNICVSPGQPATGQFGTRVTIHGTNLLGEFGGTDIVEVKLAGEKVSVTICSVCCIFHFVL
jgi:hypothetical protein